MAPKIVVTLGVGAMQATCWAFGLRPPRRLAETVAEPITLNEVSTLVPLYHPSRTVLNTTRSLEVQREDWRKVGALLGSG